MSTQDIVGEKLYTYAMELFFKTGHVATLKPEFINHSPEQFAYFDNRTDVSLTREQRSLFKAFNNVSRLFSVNRCVFFSINLLTSKVNRSQAAHDIHTMIHPVVEADGTICLFCHDDEVMLSFLGFGLRCILSDWYPMADENETLLEKLDIANFSIVRGTDYFSDMIYLLARNYYQSGQPSTYELIPIDFRIKAKVLLFFRWTFVLLCGMCLCCKGGAEMARINIEELYRGEGGGAKYGVGGIMGPLCRKS